MILQPADGRVHVLQLSEEIGLWVNAIADGDNRESASGQCDAEVAVEFLVAVDKSASVHVDVDRQIVNGEHYCVMWNVDVELVGSGPIVDVRDVGEFVDIIVCPVIGHAVAVSCAAVDAHLQDEVVNVLGKTFQVFLDRRPCLVFLPIFGGDFDTHCRPPCCVCFVVFALDCCQLISSGVSLQTKAMFWRVTFSL